MILLGVSLSLPKRKKNYPVIPETNEEINEAESVLLNELHKMTNPKYVLFCFYGLSKWVFHSSYLTGERKYRVSETSQYMNVVESLILHKLRNEEPGTWLFIYSH